MGWGEQMFLSIYLESESNIVSWFSPPGVLRIECCHYASVLLNSYLGVHLRSFLLF